MVKWKLLFIFIISSNAIFGDRYDEEKDKERLFFTELEEMNATLKLLQEYLQKIYDISSQYEWKTYTSETGKPSLFNE